MARPRKSTKQKEVAGAFKHDPQRRPENEPVPTGDIGLPPEHFGEAQQLIWFEIIGLVPDGVLTNMDRIALEGACATLECIREISRGAIVIGDKGVAIRFSSAMHQTLISYLSRMGMTPADRSRVNVGSKPESSKFDKKEWN